MFTSDPNHRLISRQISDHFIRIFRQRIMAGRDPPRHTGPSASNSRSDHSDPPDVYATPVPRSISSGIRYPTPSDFQTFTRSHDQASLGAQTVTRRYVTPARSQLNPHVNLERYEGARFPRDPQLHTPAPYTIDDSRMTASLPFFWPDEVEDPDESSPMATSTPSNTRYAGRTPYPVNNQRVRPQVIAEGQGGPLNTNGRVAAVHVPNVTTESTIGKSLIL